MEEGSAGNHWLAAGGSELPGTGQGVGSSMETAFVHRDMASALPPSALPSSSRGSQFPQITPRGLGRKGRLRKQQRETYPGTQGDEAKDRGGAV